MQDKLKESISKSEHLVELFAERERELQFFSSGHKSQGDFFSQEGTNPKELGSFQGIYFQLSCTVPYSTTMAHFSRKNLWARFWRRGIFFKLENPYSPYRSV